MDSFKSSEVKVGELASEIHSITTQIADELLVIRNKIYDEDTTLSLPLTAYQIGLISGLVDRLVEHVEALESELP